MAGSRCRAARRDIGRDQEIDLAALEGIERLGSLRLLEIAVDVAHVQPACSS